MRIHPATLRDKIEKARIDEIIASSQHRRHNTIRRHKLRARIISVISHTIAWGGLSLVIFLYLLARFNGGLS